MHGLFNGNIPLLDIEVISPIIPKVRKTFSVTIDTGFTGDLSMSYKDALPLALTLTGIQEYTLANGETMSSFECLGFIKVGNKTKLATISINQNGSLLLGISFLKKLGCKLNMDFPNNAIKVIFPRKAPLSKVVPPTSDSA